MYAVHLDYEMSVQYILNESAKRNNNKWIAVDLPRVFEYNLFDIAKGLWIDCKFNLWPYEKKLILRWL